MEMSARTAAIAERLRFRLVAAAATPMTGDGVIDVEVCRSYFSGLVSTGAEGLAIAAHTGRGSEVAPAEREQLVRAAAELDVVVIAGVGLTADASGEDRRMDDLTDWAARAAAAGADALLVAPPSDPQNLDQVIEYHETLAAASGLPLIVFDLYLRPYPTEVLDVLLDLSSVAAVKSALLSDAIGCQEAIALAREHSRLPITGEDRMFGPSLTWGAEGALVGIASAAVDLSARVLAAYHDGDADAFVASSMVLDRFARATFRPPYDGYIQRMLWVAAAEGLIPDAYAHDTHRHVALSEREEVLRIAEECRRAGDITA